jgi:hypothetical protein
MLVLYDKGIFGLISESEILTEVCFWSLNRKSNGYCISAGTSLKGRIKNNPVTQDNSMRCAAKNDMSSPTHDPETIHPLFDAGKPGAVFYNRIAVASCGKTG